MIEALAFKEPMVWVKLACRLAMAEPVRLALRFTPIAAARLVDKLAMSERLAVNDALADADADA
jgi:hypothetical protein